MSKSWDDMTDDEKAEVRRRKQRTMVFRFRVTGPDGFTHEGRAKGEKQWVWDDMTDVDREVYLEQLRATILRAVFSVDIDTIKPLCRNGEEWVEDTP